MSETSTEPVALASFRHRQDYDEVAGRDRWTVRADNGWVRATLPPVLVTILGIEKLVPTFRDLEVFLQLLPRSSTRSPSPWSPRQPACSTRPPPPAWSNAPSSKKTPPHPCGPTICTKPSAQRSATPPTPQPAPAAVELPAVPPSAPAGRSREGYRHQVRPNRRTPLPTWTTRGVPALPTPERQAQGLRQGARGSARKQPKDRRRVVSLPQG